MNNVLYIDLFTQLQTVGAAEENGNRSRVYC